MSSWPWTGDTGVRGPLGRRKQKCKVMQSDADTARTEIWDSSFPLSSLPVFLSFLETPPPLWGAAGIWAGLMLTKLSALLNSCLRRTKI